MPNFAVLDLSMTPVKDINICQICCQKRQKLPFIFKFCIFQNPFLYIILCWIHPQPAATPEEGDDCAWNSQWVIFCHPHQPSIQISGIFCACQRNAALQFGKQNSQTPLGYCTLSRRISRKFQGKLEGFPSENFYPNPTLSRVEV